MNSQSLLYGRHSRLPYYGYRFPDRYGAGFAPYSSGFFNTFPYGFPFHRRPPFFFSPYFSYFPDRFGSPYIDSRFYPWPYYDTRFYSGPFYYPPAYGYAPYGPSPGFYGGMDPEAWQSMESPRPPGYPAPKEPQETPPPPKAPEAPRDARPRRESAAPQLLQPRDVILTLDGQRVASLSSGEGLALGSGHHTLRISAKPSVTTAPKAQPN